MRSIPIDLSSIDLTEREYRIANRILNKGNLRASKPTVKPEDPETGIAAYVWRMVAWSVSDDRKHQCMPVCADFDLPGRYGSDERKAAQAEGDLLEDKITKSIPPTQWRGILRWGEAYGLVGTPRYNEEGAVVYRLEA